MPIVIRADLGSVVAVVLGLVLFGLAFNALVGALNRKGYLEGYMGLVVALGSLVTIGALSILSIDAALLSLVCFAASGTPMIIGSIVRYSQARAAEIEALKRGLE